jgi:hypothetical protein
MNMGFERRIPRTIDREPERRIFKLPFWFNRFEMMIVMFVFALSLTVGYFAAEVWGVVGGIVVTILAFFGVARWKKGRPPSYMWETFYRNPVTRWLVRGQRWVIYTSREVALNPSVPPRRSLFNGTGEGGLAITEPWHEYANPIGDPSRPLIAWQRFAKPRYRPQVSDGKEPAPAWFAHGTVPDWCIKAIEQGGDKAVIAREWLVRPTLSCQESLIEHDHER